MPERPVQILKKLNDAGFAAYFVGGCVRDTLLGRPVHDWDIATSALPEQTMAVFPKCVPTGLKHGTVTVVEDGQMYEVTTFRCEGDYADHRHPEKVTFVRDPEQDLARRDFTVNAMAMDAGGSITDLFGGREDLQNRILRCVGDPDTRFGEDALRMLRALRFSAQLDFTVEEETYGAISRCAPMSAGLSRERVREELEKTLLSPQPQKAREMAELGLLCAVNISKVRDLHDIVMLPVDRTVRWAAFFRACPQADREYLRLDKRTGTVAKNAALLSGTTHAEWEWKYLISRHGEDIALCTAALDGKTGLVRSILSSGQCLFLKDLAVNGGDFPHLQGRKVGALLHLLLLHVLDHPEDNERETLLELARKL